MSKEDLQKYQMRKGRELVEYAIENSAFFKKHYHNCNIRHIWDLPTVTKNVMMENLTKYNTIGFTKEELINFTSKIEQEQNFNERLRGYNIAMSSGTSGSRGIVITSPSEEKYLQAAFFARFSFPRVMKIKWAFLLRNTTPAFQVSKFGQKLTHISLSLTLEKMRTKLQEFQPNILSAPPSMLKILAKEIIEGRLDIKPKRLVSYAEVLHPDIKSEIEKVFNIPVHEIYQGSEGPIAMTCKHGSLHINEDLMYVQLFDSEGNPTPPGEPSFKMIVTDLNKRSQPIIRFELNDIITISPEQCSCGSSFRVIEQIMGRVDDLFWAQRVDTNELQFIFPDYIRRAIISSSGVIQEYQAIQESHTKIIVRILTNNISYSKEEAITNIQTSIQRVFSDHNCITPSVDVRFESPTKNPISAKLIRIHRAFEI